jgi:hypothetical protein
LLKDGKDYFYFDSFGFPASAEVEDQIGEYIYSDVQIQNIDSSSCGYFCLAFMLEMRSRKDKKSAYEDFLKLFSGNTKNNEMVLHQLLD